MSYLICNRGIYLVVVKDKHNDEIVSFKDYTKNFDKFLDTVDLFNHRLLLVRYLIPPIPDDMHQYDDVVLPPQYEEVVRQIINYCDLHFSSDNVTLQKWGTLIDSLSLTGVKLDFPGNTEDVPLEQLKLLTGSTIDYRKIRAKLILKEKVEKHTVVIPLFILFLAFFCSPPTAKTSFAYHFLFTATGDAKQRSMSRGDISFFQLFNQLLDESLLLEQRFDR